MVQIRLKASKARQRWSLLLPLWTSHLQSVSSSKWQAWFGQISAGHCKSTVSLFQLKTTLIKTASSQEDLSKTSSVKKTVFEKTFLMIAASTLTACRRIQKLAILDLSGIGWVNDPKQRSQSTVCCYISFENSKSQAMASVLRSKSSLKRRSDRHSACRIWDKLSSRSNRRIWSTSLFCNKRIQKSLESFLNHQGLMRVEARMERNQSKKDQEVPQLVLHQSQQMLAQWN